MLIAGMMGGIELGKYEGIDFTPPQGAREAAKRALGVREGKPASQKGMTPVGIARARDLMNGVKLSPDTVRRMKAFFDRHEVDKKGATWNEQGKGWQAWNGWGGDAGYAWAKKVVRQMNARDEELSTKKKQIELVAGTDCGQSEDGTFGPDNKCAVGHGRPSEGEETTRPGGQFPENYKRPQDQQKKAEPKKPHDWDMPKTQEEALQKYKYVKESQPHRYKTISEWEPKNKNLSYERALVTDEDGNIITERGGKEHSVTFTDKELSKMDNKNAILTHNHPSDVGFSNVDFRFARDYNLKEMRAVGKFRTYTMERPEAGWPTEAELNGEIRRATARVSRKIKKEIDSGKASWTFANSSHHHLVAEEVAKKLKIRYEVRATQ